MCGYQLVLRDVDLQVLLQEHLHAALGSLSQSRRCAQGSHGHTRQRLDDDHDARVISAADEVVDEVAQVLHAESFVAVELDPQGSDLSFRARVFRGSGRCVLCDGLVGGYSGEVHLSAAVNCEHALAVRSGEDADAYLI